MNKSNKIQEAEVQLENREHYQPLEAPMVSNTQTKVNQIIDKLHRGKHIDDMTKSKETESKSWIHYSLMGFEDKCITFNQEKQFYM